MHQIKLIINLDDFVNLVASFSYENQTKSHIWHKVAVPCIAIGWKYPNIDFHIFQYYYVCVQQESFSLRFYTQIK